MLLWVLFSLLCLVGFVSPAAHDATVSTQFLQQLLYLSSWENQSQLRINGTAFPNLMQVRPDLGRRPIHILIIGDSLDRNIVTSLCDDVGTSPRTYVDQPPAHVDFETCSMQYRKTFPVRKVIDSVKNNVLCQAPNNVTVSVIMVLGLLKEGQHQCFRRRVTDGWAFMQNKTVRAPDLVVLKGFYWDIRYICSRAPCTEHSTVHGDSLTVYHGLLEDAVDVLQRLFPTSTLALKIDPLWNQEANRFGRYQPPLITDDLIPYTAVTSPPPFLSSPHHTVYGVRCTGSPVVIHHLGLRINNHIRLVAATRGLPLLDYFRVYETNDYRNFLFDDIHPTDLHNKIIGSTLIGFVDAIRGWNWNKTVGTLDNHAAPPAMETPTAPT